MVAGPFSDDPIGEVHLPRAPLVHVVAQVRFPRQLQLDEAEGVAPVHARLRDDYPVLREDKSVGVVLTTDGMAPQPQKETVWRFQTRDQPGWQVSLSDGFVALDTAAYVSRSDFCERFGTVLSAVAEIADPVIADRVGIRYVDRLGIPHERHDLKEFVRPELLAASTIPRGDSVNLQHSICESLFEFRDRRMLARWGVVPAGAVLDPLFEASPETSWVLDLDVFRAGRMDFNVDALTASVGEFAGQAYRFFRWAVTEKLIKESGGNV